MPTGTVRFSETDGGDRSYESDDRGEELIIHVTNGSAKELILSDGQRVYYEIGRRGESLSSSSMGAGTASESTGQVRLSNSELLVRIASSETTSQERVRLICTAELVRFSDDERDTLIELLWQYIQDHRNSNNRDELVAVGSAIRKYVANMPLEDFGRISNLLEPIGRVPLPVMLELEVVKMVFHHFCQFPPATTGAFPELEDKIWSNTRAYMMPQIIGRDDYGTVAALGVAAIIAMRSDSALEAWRATLSVPHEWFRMLVEADLEDLHASWQTKNVAATEWLNGLRRQTEIRAE